MHFLNMLNLCSLKKNEKKKKNEIENGEPNGHNHCWFVFLL